MNATDKLSLQEEADGSAVVNFEPEEGATNGAQQAASTSEADDHADDGADGHEEDGGAEEHADGAAGEQSTQGQNRGITDAQRELLRQRRREERKNKKAVQHSKFTEAQRENQRLRAENEQIQQRLVALEKRSTGADLARIDKGLEDANLRVAYAEQKIKEALAAADGDAMVKAQNMLFEQKRVVEQLTATKHAFVKTANSAGNGGSAQQAQPDTAVQRMARSWVNKRPWYDPNLGDTDSRIANIVDQELTAEGFDPKTQEYWDELDDRLEKRLPHLYEGGDNAGQGNTASASRHRTMITGNSRSGNSGQATRPGEFRLSADRVKAMKDAGIWENPEKRNAMIKKYAQYDRDQRRS